MSSIQSPDDVNVAVVPLPAGQDPYGADCQLDRTIQSVFFHYDVDARMAKFAADLGFCRIKNIRLADPDGSEEQRQLFSDSIGANCGNVLACAIVRAAFRRLLRPDPMAAIVASSSVSTPAAKRPRPSASASASSGSASAGSSSAASSAPSSSSSAPVAPAGGDPPAVAAKTASKDPDASDLSEVSSSDEDVIDDADKEASRDDARVSRSSDIPTLFDTLGSEVSLVA